MAKVLERINGFIRLVFTLPIRFYQKFISPLLPRFCLYEPGCSEYTLRSIRRFGIVRGMVLGAARIFRCNGLFFDGGDDDVPERFSLAGIRDDYRKFRRRKAR